jgi:hypothetical protein
MVAGNCVYGLYAVGEIVETVPFEVVVTVRLDII